MRKEAEDGGVRSRPESKEHGRITSEKVMGSLCTNGVSAKPKPSLERWTLLLSLPGGGGSRLPYSPRPVRDVGLFLHHNTNARMERTLDKQGDLEELYQAYF